MNKVVLMGRLTRDPDVRYTHGDPSVAVARYTLAVNRYRKNGGDQPADFVPCVVFRKGAEFAEKYLHQGMKLLVSGKIQTGSYVNKDGQKIYTMEVVVAEQEFAEKKSVSSVLPVSLQTEETDDGFLELPETMEDFPFQ
ncbi:MAG: single-stranded DNA-binding protein [Lachnospiraceae bacterium]|nr:single-stranded DNA-binding protein [Lachnospiraceae bacterium]